MKQLFPDLWQLSKGNMFGMNAHAYLLTHSEGNVLFYNPHQDIDFEKIAELGGAKYLYLSHNHEINKWLEEVKYEFSLELCCHQNALPYFSETLSPDVLFDSKKSQNHAIGIEVLYTPGHTNNNICCRYKSPYGKTYLFIGDTLYQHHGDWRALVVRADGGDAEILKESLQWISELDVNVPICNVSIGDTHVDEVEQSDWRKSIHDAVSTL